MSQNKFNIDPEIMKRVNTWLEGDFDENVKREINNLLDDNPDEIIDAFYRDLEFGTGGMRGTMGPGTNRMNIYTVGMATQGLCNYLITMFPDKEEIKVAIAYDSRNNNTLFAQTAANVFSANDILVYLFESIRPTPELSFAIRYLGCQSGLVITASHNPKEYNGYKVYWDDGAQIITPHDNKIIEEVKKITNIKDVNFESRKELIKIIGEEVDNAYLEKVKALLLAPHLDTKKDVKIVYTPLHGTGGRLIPRVLKDAGYDNITLIDEQMIEDGNFPTAKSPNPEEPAALEMALKKAVEIDADVVMATDPDADRVGIAVKDHNNEFILLNGNQTGAIIIQYLLEKWKQKGMLTPKEYIVKTIVTTELIKDIADNFNVNCYDVLTGFKWIAGLVREKEGEENYIAGLEESFGYMIGDFVRDKDAVSAALIISEMVAVAISEGKSLFDKLLDIYCEYGFYKEVLISVYRHGKSGVEEIKQMMADFRNKPPKEIAGSTVVMIKDYLSLTKFDILKNSANSITLIPKSNVLQFYTEEGNKISIRPSGTEPKIKFYFSVKVDLKSKEDYKKINAELDEKIENIISSLNLK